MLTEQGDHAATKPLPKEQQPPSCAAALPDSRMHLRSQDEPLKCVNSFEASKALLGDSWPVHTYVKRLSCKLGDDTAIPLYIFTRRGVGYWMERGEE